MVYSHFSSVKPSVPSLIEHLHCNGEAKMTGSIEEMSLLILLLPEYYKQGMLWIVLMLKESSGGDSSALSSKISRSHIPHNLLVSFPAAW